MPLRFKLNIEALPVILENNGKDVAYEIREMVAADRDQYLDTVSERVRIDKDGNAAGIKKFDGMQADLLSRCLFLTEEGKSPSLVAKSVIQGWPSSVVSGLFLEAQKLNKLNAVDKSETEESSKKD